MSGGRFWQRRNPWERKNILGLAVAATLALSACSGTANNNPQNGSQPAAPSATPIPPVTPTSDAKKSARGNQIKQLGEVATINNGSTLIVKFTVDAITPIECTEKYSHAAENGQMVAVTMTVETTPELADASNPTFSVSAYNFKFIAQNGTTFTGNLSTIATYSCIPASQTFPSAGMGPAEKIQAKVLLDAPAAHGILVLQPAGFSRGGFEYTF